MSAHQYSDKEWDDLKQTAIKSDTYRFAAVDSAADPDCPCDLSSVWNYFKDHGWETNEDENSWKTLTLTKEGCRIDVCLIRPKTTAAVTTTAESVKRHQLALESYYQTGKWIEVRTDKPKSLKEERQLGLRQAHEIKLRNNVVTADDALSTPWAFMMHVTTPLKSKGEGKTLPPIYGEVSSGTDMVDEIKKAFRAMLAASSDLPLLEQGDQPARDPAPLPQRPIV